jgi:hypothetical protein
MQLLQALDAREFITALFVKGGPPPQYTCPFVIAILPDDDLNILQKIKERLVFKVLCLV